jgi:hypothetical protein
MELRYSMEQCSEWPVDEQQPLVIVLVWGSAGPEKSRTHSQVVNMKRHEAAAAGHDWARQLLKRP